MNSWRPVLAFLAFSLAACGSTDHAVRTANARWIGQPVDSFFARNGPPKRDHSMAGGGKVYFWETVAMPSGTRTKITCSADIVSDPKGMITDIRLKEDSIGHWNTSRCTEIFGSE